MQSIARPQSAFPGRAAAIDIARGLAIVLMMLDHTREFLHVSASDFQPNDLDRTTTVLFITRLVTDYCAPTFMICAGMSAYWRGRSCSPSILSRYLALRGLALIVLDFTVTRFPLPMDFPSPIVLSILWALGWSMLFLSIAARWRLSVLVWVCLSTIALHNLLDPVDPSVFGAYAPIWLVLHQQALFVLHGVPVVTAYPLVPWFAVMGLGYAMSRIWTWDEARRRRLLISISLVSLFAFIALRAAGGYGDPFHWSVGLKAPVLGFFRCTKYPPSLQYLLMTISCSLMVLATATRWPAPIRDFLSIYGRVPLFVFIVHLYILKGLSLLLPKLTLPAVYVVWSGVVLIMIPLSVAYEKHRSASKRSSDVTSI